MTTRRSADDREHRVTTTGAQFNECLQGEVHALEGLQASHEEQQRRHTVKAQGVTRLGPVARREERVLDTEGHDVDALGVGVVELHELFGLDLATGEHRVGAGEDRRLLKGALLRFGFEVLSLDSLQGVKRHDERDVQFVLQTMTDQPAQPVVRVDRVG